MNKNFFRIGALLGGMIFLACANQSGLKPRADDGRLPNQVSTDSGKNGKSDAADKKFDATIKINGPRIDFDVQILMVTSPEFSGTVEHKCIVQITQNGKLCTKKITKNDVAQRSLFCSLEPGEAETFVSCESSIRLYLTAINTTHENLTDVLFGPTQGGSKTFLSGFGFAQRRSINITN